MRMHGRDRGFEIAVLELAALERAAPEIAFLFRAAAEGENDGQGDLALAEIVADILAELHRSAAVVERVIDELKGDTEIDAIAAAGGDLGFGRWPRIAPTSQAAPKSAAVLARMTA